MSGNMAAVILAAGLSSRMGEFKPLLTLAGATVLERTIGLFLEAGVADIRVVTGHRSDELRPIIRRLGVREILNPHYADGMFSSVQAAVATLDDEVEAFFVHPVDLPLVRPSTVRRLVKGYREGQSGIVYPAFLGRRGHPPLISGWLAPEIARWSGAAGLHGILVEWEGVAHEVEVADEQILRDMDTPDDYRSLLGRVERLEIPSEAECRALLEKVLQVEPPIRAHGEAVAELAVRMGERLNQAGCTLDLTLLKAAGLLHDLARKEPDHAKAGAVMLEELGYGAVADVVATHMDITVSEQEPISAGEVVYLADKVMQGAKRVPLAERFGKSVERHGADPAVMSSITQRYVAACKIQSRLETVTGFSMTEVLGSI